LETLIQIRAVAKRNVFTSILLGVLGLILSFVIIAWLPKNIYLLGIFLTGASLVALLIGWFKFREPLHSVELSPEFICYINRHGKWKLTWDNIQRIDVPRVQKGFDQKDLAVVGIKIKDYAPLLRAISPRLMSNILMEQRPLLLHNPDDKHAKGTGYSEALLERDHYKGSDGVVLKGMQAMMANRMTKLREQLGYDLFIGGAELDRSEQEFVQLLRQCHSHATLAPNESID
jgi:hypothetical protein